MSLTAEMIREAIPHAGEVVWRDGQTTEKIFLEKMAKQIENGKRKLSEKQEALTSKIMHRALSRSVTPQMTQEEKDNRYGEGGYEAINEMFKVALASGLKRPSITLDNEMGELVTIKVAGVRSRYTGQIQITSEDDLSDLEKKRLKRTAQYNNQDGNSWKAYNASINQKYHGRINAAGLLVKSRDYNERIVDDLLKALATDPSATVAAFGAKTGRCAMCGRPLKTHESTTHGYGPVCAKRYGLVWGKKAADEQDSEAVEQIRDAVATSTFAVFGADTRWGVYENDELLMVFDERPKAAAWVHDVDGNFNIRAITNNDATEASTGDTDGWEDEGWFD